MKYCNHGAAIVNFKLKTSDETIFTFVKFLKTSSRIDMAQKTDGCKIDGRHDAIEF